MSNLRLMKNLVIYYREKSQYISDILNFNLPLHPLQHYSKLQNSLQNSLFRKISNARGALRVRLNRHISITPLTIALLLKRRIFL